MSDHIDYAWRPNPADSRYRFASPAISAAYDNGWWIITREGKGDWLRFGPAGGLLYRTRETEPVGTIYINDDPTADCEPYYSRRFTRACECGQTRFPDYRIESFVTAAEAIEAAAFHFIC
ncbi:hypothetical protein D7D52_16930 [Nocardia yunnanensis]|uniref:Uncharacterized protein n=1 Tax=Nocardia yunnanensis TaxID=2382165 RepID=A0A386ZF80_9NOCA|nr:hypothetical protein [Nocardia yunnanensis]AYF75275.1 hypothetical protein D7D52_16930 [Nocardia yunnanensis]